MPACDDVGASPQAGDCWSLILMIVTASSVSAGCHVPPSCTEAMLLAAKDSAARAMGWCCQCNAVCGPVQQKLCSPRAAPEGCLVCCSGVVKGAFAPARSRMGSGGGHHCRRQSRVSAQQVGLAASLQGSPALGQLDTCVAAMQTVSHPLQHGQLGTTCCHAAKIAWCHLLHCCCAAAEHPDPRCV